jgi:hypothetical protein
MAALRNNKKPRKPDSFPEHEGVREDPSPAHSTQLATELHMSGQSSLSDMDPGDIIFLDDFEYLRESFAPCFIAVLACPLCGSPSLITSIQYSRGAPIVCSSKLCSGMFRIVEEAKIISLPAN